MTSISSAIATLEAEERNKLAMEIASRVLLMRTKFDRTLIEQKKLEELIVTATTTDINDRHAVEEVLQVTQKYSSDDFGVRRYLN